MVRVRVTVILRVYVMILFCRGIALFPVFYAFRIEFGTVACGDVSIRQVVSERTEMLRMTKRQSLSWNMHKQIYRHTENSTEQGTGASTFLVKNAQTVTSAGSKS